MEVFKNLDERILEEIYRGLLFRLPLERERDRFIKHIKNMEVHKIIREIVKSEEFMSEGLRRNLREQGPLIRPKKVVDKPVNIFIHIPKTAGTSLYQMLKTSLGEEKVGYSYILTSPPAYYMKYEYLIGHFDYDLAYYLLPNREKKFYTILRNPIDRLISKYLFFKSHDPNIFQDVIEVQLADQLDIVSFFKSENVRKILNHKNEIAMWVLGNIIFSQLILSISTFKTHQEKEDFIESKFRELIKNRLSSFEFILLQEDFERATRALFHILNIPYPGLAKKNITEEKMKYPGYRKIDKPEITEELLSVLQDLVFIDKVVYEEGLEIYKRRIKELTKVDSLPYVIDFRAGGNAGAFIRSGFCYPEEWGTWITDKEAILEFNLPYIPQNLYMKLSFSIFTAKGKHKQHIDIFFNDQLVFSKDYLQDSDEVVVDISGLAKHENKLQIRSKDIVSPKQLGIGEDIRPLSIGLSKIEILSGDVNITNTTGSMYQKDKVEVRRILTLDSKKLIYIYLNTKKPISGVVCPSSEVLINYIPDNHDWNLICIAPKDTTSIPLVIKYLDGSEEIIEVKI